MPPGDFRKERGVFGVIKRVSETKDCNVIFFGLVHVGFEYAVERNGCTICCTGGGEEV